MNLLRPLALVFFFCFLLAPVVVAAATGEPELMKKENFQIGFYQSPTYSMPEPAPTNQPLWGLGLAGAGLLGLLFISMRKRKK